MSAAAELHSFPTEVAERYRVVQLLGTGGMGEVHSVVDQTSGRRLALKRLLPGASATQRSLFEREFHTLASLKHPNIVEVYDFGVADDAPYYTMELLEGSDLRELSPMPWREVCRCLRDVATTLGLLHARRLLHRDISPRNIWRNKDGSVKVLDFGALASFGLPRNVTGTPAFIPPEAMHAQPLDARADLFMLGALGYWLLSGKLPYQARQLGDLFEAWKTPPAPPSSHIRALQREDIPEPPSELDQLIESLLSLSPAGRPTSTADVVDHLSELGGLDRVSQTSAAQGYIHSRAFVGRERERDQLVTHLNTALSGVGGTFLYESPAGTGRTRLLAELSLSARLSGATVLAAAGGDDGPYALAHSLAIALLDATPEAALTAAKRHAPVLGHLSPALHARLGGKRVALLSLSDTTGERRVRTLSALRDWLLEVAKKRLLVVAVDDLEQVDEGSLALLVSLADVAKEHRLLLLGTLSTDAAEAGAAVHTLRQLATRVRLAPLSLDQVRELFRSVFDDVPHLSRLSERLYRAAQGNPAYLVELAEHLVRTEVIRYADGGWLLPAEFSDAQLPQSRDAAILERLQHLSHEGRSLAQMLSVERGALTTATCVALSELPRTETEIELSMLCHEGVLSHAQDAFRFSHEILREALFGELSDARKKHAHAVLGQLSLQKHEPNVVDRLEAGLHVLRSGDARRGAEIIANAAKDLKGPDAVTSAVPALKAALELFRAAGYDDYELLLLLGRLATASYYTDRRLAPYGTEAIAMFARLFKLDRARPLSRLVGKKLAVILMLAWAAVGFARRRKNPLVPDFHSALVLMFQNVSTMTGVATVCIDPDQATRYARLLAPFAALGRDHVGSLIYEFCMGLAATVRDRPSEARTRWLALLARLQSPAAIKGLPEDSRKLYVAGALYACGVLECWRDSTKALEYAEQLSQLDMSLYEMSAEQLRMLYYGNQGKLALFEECRQRVEMHAIQRGTAWQVETWAPGAFVGLYLRTNDALGMKRAAEEIRRLSEELPSLKVHARRSLGSYQLLRGKYADALTELAECLNEEPLGIIGWARAHGGLARTYNALGQHAKAREVCLRALDRISSEDLSFPAMNLGLQIEHAMALAGLGELETAAASIEALLEQHAENEGPLTLGALNEARARIALLREDYEKARDGLTIMEAWYRPTGIPSLIQRCARLDKELCRKSGFGARSETHDMPSGASALQTMFSDAQTVTQCAERMLSLVGQDAEEAYLFVAEGDSVRIAAQTEGAIAPEEVVRWTEERVRAAAEDDCTVLVEDSGDAEAENTRVVAGRAYRLTILYAVDGFQDVAVGASVTVGQDEAARLKPETLGTLCTFLYRAMLHS